MAFIRRNTPPKYKSHESYKANFPRFLEWALELRNPFKQIPEIGEELNFGIIKHPLGFTAIYLSSRASEMYAVGSSGIARVNIYPRGADVKDDIHSHGYDFESGVAAGALLHTRHFPDFSHEARLPDGEGYIGYETRVDPITRINRLERVTTACISEPSSQIEILNPGDTYSLRPRIDFHSVASEECGAITIFCKTPTYTGQDGDSLVLVKPGRSSGMPSAY